MHLVALPQHAHHVQKPLLGLGQPRPPEGFLLLLPVRAQATEGAESLRSLKWFCNAPESRRCGRAGWSIMPASALSSRPAGNPCAARLLSTDSPTRPHFRHAGGAAQPATWLTAAPEAGSAARPVPPAV